MRGFLVGTAQAIAMYGGGYAMYLYIDADFSVKIVLGVMTASVISRIINRASHNDDLRKELLEAIEEQQYRISELESKMAMFDADSHDEIFKEHEERISETEEQVEILASFKSTTIDCLNALFEKTGTSKIVRHNN